MKAILKKHRAVYALVTAALLLGGTGCTTFYEADRRAAQEREDFLILREDIRRMEGRLENYDIEIEQLWKKVNNLETGLARRQDEAARRHETELAEVRSAIEQLRQARIQDRKEIVAKISASVSDIVAKTARSSSSGARISEYGVEHTVQPGETLSEIASAYGVRTKMIIQANEIKDPNRLQVGQKLFIPE